MFASMKKDAMKYVIWEGIRGDYPKWFWNSASIFIDDYIYDKAFTTVGDSGPILVQEGDVFVMNDNEGVRYFKQQSFRDIFQIINHKECALKKDVFRFHDDVDLVFDHDSEELKEEHYVVLVNQKNEMMEMRYDVFEDLFVYL